MFKVGVRIRYLCSSGFEASGKAEQLCLNGGKWSGLKVVCSSGESSSACYSRFRVKST